MRFFAAVILLFLIHGFVHSQDKLEFGDTPTTSLHPKYKQNPKDYKKQNVIYFIKNNGKGLFLGNSCVEEIYAKMGFTYLVQVDKNHPSQKHFPARQFHNLGASMLVFFKNGPFWRMRVRKKRKECLLQTRDFMG